jgi:transglutaminase-like putative cysteine protease
MRMTIRYLTTFTYDTHVSESQNALRAKPASDERQRLLAYSVTAMPLIPIRIWVVWIRSTHHNNALK